LRRTGYFLYRVSTKIGYSVNMLLLRNYLYNHSYILHEVLHWGLLKFSNEDINYSTSVIIFCIKTLSISKRECGCQNIGSIVAVNQLW